MNNDIEEQLSKSRTKYRNLHQLPSPTKSKIIPNEDSDDDTTLPTFVNQFFSPKTPITNISPSNDTGMFRAIRGQVIIHHDDDRSSKVQCEDEQDDDDEEEEEEELENLPVIRSNVGNYELHYDVDNPLEISCSMSLSSAETISDHSPSPIRHTSSININGNNPNFKREDTPIEPSSPSSSSSSSDDGDDTPSSILSDNDHDEKIVIDHDNIKEHDEKLRTFRGWHLSMLKQIDEKLREIELETATNTNPTTPVNQNKKSLIKPLTNKKKFLRPTIHRRFETTNIKRHNSPVPQIKINSYRSRTPSVEKESRTLIINLPPSPSSSSISDNEQDFPPPPPAPSEPIHIRIVQSPIYQTNQRSQSTERLILRDQGAQTEPFNQSNNFIDHRSVRPASIECDRIQPTRSLTRTQGNRFLQQQQQQKQQNQRPTEQIKFYSLRSRNIQSRPSIVTQSPMSKAQLPPTPIVYNQSLPIEKKIQSPPSNVQSSASTDPSIYSDDYGHVTQMDTTNLGSLVDKVFDDIYQDKPSDFYRDYRQLLNDIQIRFSMISSVEQPSIINRPPPPPPPLPPLPNHRPPLPSQPVFVDYSRPSQTPISQARLLDTLIYIPNSL
jgi:hypothetical protein